MPRSRKKSMEIYSERMVGVIDLIGRMAQEPDHPFNIDRESIWHIQILERLGLIETFDDPEVMTMNLETGDTVYGTKVIWRADK